jgi:ATP-binding protein involved in chromosome partitioning
MPLKVLSTRSIAIAAGKGGVGKSTFTLLLAGAFKRKGERVGILDADLYGPSLRQMLPEQRLPKQAAGKIVPGMAGGIQTISLAYFQQEAVVRAPVANRLLAQFFQKVAWDGVTQLLVDFPPGTGDIPITAAQMGGLSGAVIVTTPQKVALLDVRKTIALFQKTGVPILGIAENMSGPVFGDGGGRALSEEFGVPFLGSIPLDPAIREAGDSGTLLDLEYADPMVEKLGEGQRNPIKEIFLSGKRIQIVWEGGGQSVLSAPALQKACPCVRCREGSHVEQNVAFLNYERIGRYGLRFDFSSGCSYGIYDFALLKRFT